MAFSPYMMKDVDLILGDEATGPNFKCQVKSIKLTPSVNVVKTKTACPTGQYSASDDPEWTLEVGYLYGMDGATTPAPVLADYLLEHVGGQLPFLFRPIAGGKGYSGMVTIIPGSIGGEVGSYSEQSVQLPLDGQPVPVEAV